MGENRSSPAQRIDFLGGDKRAEDPRLCRSLNDASAARDPPETGEKSHNWNSRIVE